MSSPHRLSTPRAAGVAGVLFAVLFGGATALLPMFAKDVLHVGPWGLGLLHAAPAVGALVMSALLGLALTGIVAGVERLVLRSRGGV